MTLAVGIGSSTAMFSSLRTLVVHPFDYPDSQEIVQIWSGGNGGWPLSPADFLDQHEQTTSFETFGVYAPGTVNIGLENAQAVSGVRATAGVLPTFGIAPFRGRFFGPDDCLGKCRSRRRHQPQPLAADLRRGPERRRRTVRLNGADATVIGIMPAGFEFAAPWMRTEDCQIWLPYRFTEKERKQRDSHYLCGIARLKKGVTVGAADAEVKAIGKKLTALYPDSNTRKEFLVRSLREEMTKDVSDKVWLLFGAVALVLLVACANVASMLLARSAQRQGEYGVRVALGATRGRLVRLALTESLLLAALGVVFGLLIAYGGIKVLQVITPTTAARKAALVLDGIALLFAVGAGLLTALLAGLPPALAAARTSLSGIIRSDARGAVGSRSRHVMLRTLIIAQIAVAFVLANVAALFPPAISRSSSRTSSSPPTTSSRPSSACAAIPIRRTRPGCASGRRSRKNSRHSPVLPPSASPRSSRLRAAATPTPLSTMRPTIRRSAAPASSVPPSPPAISTPWASNSCAAAISRPPTTWARTGISESSSTAPSSRNAGRTRIRSGRSSAPTKPRIRGIPPPSSAWSRTSAVERHREGPARDVYDPAGPLGQQPAHQPAFQPTRFVPHLAAPLDRRQSRPRAPAGKHPHPQPGRA